MKKIEIIAEIGNNHNGNYNLACRMVESAAECGADYAKFQIYKLNKFIHKKSTYYKEFKNECLSHDNFKKIFKKYNKFIKVIATPFDNETAKFLNKLNVSAIKIASGDIDNFMMFEEILKRKNNIFFSTGASSIQEIKKTYNYLKKKSKNVVPLHCIASYPADFKILNLGYIKKLKKILNCEIGYSDHSMDITASIYAAILGSSVIEKHFTIDQNLPGGDNSMSINSVQLKSLVNFIRNYNFFNLNPKRKFHKVEKFTKKLIRRKFYASKDIKKDEKFLIDNILFLRPFEKKNVGLEGIHFKKLMKSTAKKKIKKNELIVGKNLCQN